MSSSTISVALVRPWIRVIACCFALLIAPSAMAAKNLLFKCVSAAGVTSIQSVPCPAGSTEAWRREAMPEPPPTPEQVAEAEAKNRRDREIAREQAEMLEKKLRPPAPESVAPAAPAGAEQASVDACQAAHDFATSVREKAWLALSEEQTQRLLTWVLEQCKPPEESD